MRDLIPPTELWESSCNYVSYLKVLLGSSYQKHQQVYVYENL